MQQMAQNQYSKVLKKRDKNQDLSRKNQDVEFLQSCAKNPSVYEIQKNDEQNYNINVFAPEPIEEHKSIDACSGMTRKTNNSPNKTI